MSDHATMAKAYEGEEWLASQCNRRTHGVCHTRGCLRRGGWKPGMIPVDYKMATCIPHEILCRLEKLDGGEK